MEDVPVRKLSIEDRAVKLALEMVARIPNKTIAVVWDEDGRMAKDYRSKTINQKITIAWFYLVLRFQAMLGILCCQKSNAAIEVIRTLTNPFDRYPKNIAPTS